ncbi:hypothetical protein EDB81DRAFT_105933 [Dactylonectria macrodidyma]|uniref:PWWP domain-containing protein n=1 Tax=Dactylonectria macrodidyma TaxID=307937 RepID=A0A9P9EAI3_9HYPO|nr:hypothetical protein EDB81DRAFT_105933 [Dactylonectria macrodidyma]
MADQPNEKTEVTAPAVDAQEAPAGETKPTETPVEENASKTDGKNKDDAKSTDEPKATESSEKPAESATEKPTADGEKPAADGGDTEMKDATEEPVAEEPEAESAAPPADGETAPASAAVETPAAKAKGGRRSSVGKALNRKNSKARLTHADAKPGDHFLVKLKGFPAWPAIICDESMLPHALVNSRPVTAARPDGTYAEAYADGGKRVNDRSFPVMYLHTNEFGWVANKDLTALSPEKAEETVTEKMRKDLKEAFHLAAENNPIDYYKDILKKFEEELVAQEEARKEAAATPKKSKKGKAKAVEEDLEMPDVDETEEKPKSKKRKAEDAASTPQRPDSVKKPKIKLNTSTPKANGTPKTKEESAAKPKTKSKKSGDKKAEAPKEAKLSPEERRNRKEKEVLYLRHKLQRGLLARDLPPQESEMKQMSEYITMLENFNDLEVSIIRTTKINKVLKAILKLESIPREDDFHFKDRSQSLLDKWNKLMAGDAASTPTATNGVNGKAEEKKAEANGVKDSAKEAKKDEPEKTEVAEPKSEAEEVEEKAVADKAAPEPVEATA